MKIIHKLGKRMPEIVVALVWLYVLVPFLAPLAYHNGYENIGLSINEFYENFCHQRVERSLFLFGEEKISTFYTVEDLKEAQAIPMENPNPQPFQWPEYFGHDYPGNSEVGWKVPLCIRDLALYGSFVIVGSLIIWMKRKKKKDFKIPLWLFILLLSPMVIDGLLLTAISSFKMDWVPIWFVESNVKRIITGTMFGAGFALLLIPPLFIEKRLTKGK